MEKVIVTSTQELESIVYNSVKKAIKEIGTGKTKEMDADSFLTTKEASRLLNLAPQTIYGMTCKRKIPFFKQGKKLYFKKSDLIKWLERGRVNTQSELIAEAKRFNP